MAFYIVYVTINISRLLTTNAKQARVLQDHHEKLTKKQTKDLKEWTQTQTNDLPATITKDGEQEISIIQKADYVQLVKYYSKGIFFIQTEGLYYNWADITVFFFIGMILYKSGYILGSKPKWIYAAVAFFGIFIGLVINYFILRQQYHSRFDAVTDFENYPYNLYMVRRILQTMGYISLFVLLYNVVSLKGVFNWLSPVGQMALTNYLLQSIITSVIFYGMGWFGQMQRYQLYEVVLGIWLFQIIFSNIWLKYFLFGPFEWVWRSLTYLKIQPFRKLKQTVPV